MAKCFCGRSFGLILPVILNRNFSSTIIEDVTHQVREQLNTTVLYYYFDFGNKIHGSVESLLRSLVAQLVEQTARLPKALAQLRRRKFFKERKPTPGRPMQGDYVPQPSSLELSNTFRESMLDFDHIYVILDALDECVERQKLLSLVQRLLNPKTSNIHILVTSRSDADLEKHLTPIVTAQTLVESSLVEPDILSYIQEQLYNNPKLRRWPQKIRDRIESALMTGAQGMYVMRSFG